MNKLQEEILNYTWDDTSECEREDTLEDMARQYLFLYDVVGDVVTPAGV